MNKYLIFNETTREVTGSIESTQWNAPRNAIQIETLPNKEGFAVIVNKALTACKYVADFRGEKIYNTANMIDSKTVSDLSEIETGWTLEMPTTEFDTWLNNEWMADEQALFEAKIIQVDDIRRSLYSSMSDPLISEAIIERLKGNELAATELENQAIAASEKIRTENPWPSAPGV